MKFFHGRRHKRCIPLQTGGLTVIEMVVTVAIFALVTLALVYTQLFGLKQDQLIQSKLGASDQARKGFDRLATEVRSAKIWQIGNGSATVFTPIANGTSQTGTALQISLTTDTNQYIRYYFDTTSRQLRRMHSGVTGSSLIARDLTNSMFFQAEYFDGTIQTNLSHKGVVHTTLWFAKYQYPTTLVGGGAYYDSYRMDFRLTPHVPDGP
jgi:hypothetical protein